MKKWLIKYWLTILMHGAFWTTFSLYKNGFPPIYVLSGFVLTTALARAEGDYVQGFKTDFFYKQTMSLLDNLKETNIKIKELQKTATELQKTVTK